MSELHFDETWPLYREVLKERDAARAELDTLRLMALEVMRERDQARALVQECYEMLRRIVRADERVHRERWEELDRLRERLRPLGWIPESPALSGELQREERCPNCGLRLRPGQPCLICSAAAGGEG
jgi:hypothetical protein